MEQIVVIDTDYGAQIYQSVEVPILYIDLRRWADSVPTRVELEMLKAQTLKITHPNARTYMEQWLKENEEYLEDIERPNDIEIQNARELLMRNGYEVTP